MQHSDVLRVRTEMAREMGLKAEAMRVQVRDESLRYEGAMGVLAQAMEAVDADTKANQASFAEGDIAKEQAYAARDALVAVHNKLSGMHAHAQAGLVRERGRLQQAEETLNMLEALFAADIETAKHLIEDTGLPEQAAAAPAKPGKHPGPSLATKRKAEAAKA